MIERQDSAWELDQARPIGPQLHRILRQRIVRNDLTPNSKISESDIARTFSISRQPVREAFIKLAEEGLIAIRPQRSTIVRRIDPASVLDARFVREAVEADIVKLLAQTPDPALIRNLRAQLQDQRRVAKNAPLRFIQLDERFHRTLAEAAGKINAWKLVEGLKSQLDRVRFLSLSHFPIDKLIVQHTAVTDAIAEGRADLAEAAMRAHLSEILIDLPQIQSANPDFFAETPTTSRQSLKNLEDS